MHNIDANLNVLNFKAGYKYITKQTHTVQLHVWPCLAFVQKVKEFNTIPLCEP